jgi:hypothetical protein
VAIAFGKELVGKNAHELHDPQSQPVLKSTGAWFVVRSILNRASDVDVVGLSPVWLQKIAAAHAHSQHLQRRHYHIP